MTIHHTRRNWVLFSVTSGLCIGTVGLTLVFAGDPGPGGLGGGGGTGDPVPPPGSDPCETTLCNCPQVPVEPEDFYMCVDPCVGLAMVNYDCTQLDLPTWINDHCPDWDTNGCPTDPCMEDKCEINAKLCQCEAPDFDCDVDGDDDVDCDDFKQFVPAENATTGGCITEDDVLDIMCCFLRAIQTTCEDVWIPPMGTTVCDDIRDCAEEELGRDLTFEEWERLYTDCYGGDLLDCCNCDDGTDNTGEDFLNCDGGIVCDPDGDGTDCEDFKDFIEDSKEHCNAGADYTDAELADLFCEFIKGCFPGSECAKAKEFADCLEEYQCKPLTGAQVTAIEACIGGGCSLDCCTNGYADCGDEFECDQNCDGLLNCDDIVAFIANSEDVCGAYADDDAIVAAVCDYLEAAGENCNGGGDFCSDLIDCVEGLTAAALTTTHKSDLATCSGCDDLCDNEDDQDKEDEGDDEDCASCDETDPNPSCNGTDLAYGDAIEQETDINVDLIGDDFDLSRTHTSDSDYTSGCATGEGWSTSPFQRVEDNGTNVRLVGNASAAITIQTPPAPGGPWNLPGSTSQTIDEDTVTIDAQQEDVWRLTEPGSWEKDFYRDPSETALDGLLRQTRDEHGNVHTYHYALYGTTTLVARLDRIYLNGTPGGASDPDGLVQFSYINDTSDANTGRMSEVKAYRYDANGFAVLTQRVEYTYMDVTNLTPSGDYSADLGLDGDLIQVIRYERVDPTPGEPENEAWKVAVTQYRYHRTGVTVDLTDDRPYEILAGNDHQIKMVIEPEQFEYFAQLRAADDNPTDAKSPEELAATLLALDDGDDIYLNSDEIAVDFASKINAVYETTGDKRLTVLYLQSACGCGGSATQGTEIRYTYRSRTFNLGGYNSFATVVVGEHLLDNDAVPPEYEATAYRDTVYELYRPEGSTGIPYMLSKAIVEGSNKWVTFNVHEADNRNLLAQYTPSMVTAYTPGTTSAAPSYTFSLTGLVHVYEYTSDNRVSKRKIEQGEPSFTSGVCSACTLIEAIDYGDGTGDTRKHLPDEIKRYRDETSVLDNDIEVTKFTYGFHGGSGDDVAWRKTEVESELEAENGPGGTVGGPDWYASHEIFDTNGNNTWSVAADGALTERVFSTDGHGRVVIIISNAENDLASPYEGLTTTGFGRNADGGELQTDYVYDMLGRIREVVAPGLVSTYTTRHMSEHPDRPKLLYYTQVTLPHIIDEYNVEYNGPISINWFNCDGDVIASSGYAVGSDGYTFAPADLGGYELLLTDYAVGKELTRTVTRHDISGLVSLEGYWHGIHLDEFEDPIGPNDGEHATLYTYDSLGRLVETINANATGTRLTYDVLDRVIKTEVTIATETAGVWSLDETKIKTIGEYFYDADITAGTPAQGVGNGNLNWVVQHVDDSTDRDTKTTFDWRDRPIKVENPLAPHSYATYDNLDRTIEQAVFESVPTAINAPLADRGRYTETAYSQRGRVYRQRLAIDPTLSTLTFLETHIWCDENGRTVGSMQPSTYMSKTTYDGLGRVVTTYSTDRRDDADPGAADNFEDVYTLTGVDAHTANVDGDVVFEQMTYRYIADDDISDLQTRLIRAHNTADTKTGDLDDFSGGDAARVITTYTGTYYDDADRVIRNVNYGTNDANDKFKHGGTAPTITQSSPPDPADAGDDFLVNATSYNERGLVDIVTDPSGQETRFYYDDRNRQIAVIENYDDTDPPVLGWDDEAGTTLGVWTADSNSGVGDTSNRTTAYVYDGLDNTVRQIAFRLITGADPEAQITKYVYGVTTTGTHASKLASNDILKEIRYPFIVDPNPGGGGEWSAEAIVTFEVNRAGEVIVMEDPNGTEHTYTRDDLGRVTLDLITVEGSGTDIRLDFTTDAIETIFDDFSRVSEVVSWTDHGGGGADELNGVLFEYDSLWQVTNVYQDHNEDVDTASSLKASYTYDIKDIDNGNYTRRTKLTYPDDSDVQYIYGKAGTANERISRLKNIKYGTDKVIYAYNGLGMISLVDLPADVVLDRQMYDDGTTNLGDYGALDRFGRIKMQMWVDGNFPIAQQSPGPMPPIVRLEYGYDKASNRTQALNTNNMLASWEIRDYLYDYDDLHRLTGAERGIYSGSMTRVSNSNHPSTPSEDFSYDGLGNWAVTVRDWDGDSIVDDGERETRDHSFINDMYERVIIEGATGGGDLTLDVDNDPAGNVTDEDIAEGDPNNFALLYTHDAWHRLVKVEIRDEDGTTIDPRGEYEYNGLNWCIEKRSDSDVTDGTNALNEQRMRFYNAEWQMIEERVDDDAGGFPSGPGDADNDRHERVIWGAQGINDCILHGSDTNKDGDLNDVYYHLCDPLFSTVAIIDDAATLIERTSYSAYGVGRHHRLADLDGDGDTDTGNPSDDKLLTDNLGNAGVGDLNRSGRVTTADGTILTNDVGAAEAFGAISNSTVDNQIGYAGYVFNEETQHYLARHRWYHPQLGRWLQRDPAGYVDGMSLYQYASSDPVTFTDPSGLLPRTGYRYFEEQTRGYKKSFAQSIWHRGIFGAAQYTYTLWLRLDWVEGWELVANLEFNNCGGTRPREFSANYVHNVGVQIGQTITESQELTTTVTLEQSVLDKLLKFGVSHSESLAQSKSASVTKSTAVATSGTVTDTVPGCACSFVLVWQNFTDFRLTGNGTLKKSGVYSSTMKVIGRYNVNVAGTIYHSQIALQAVEGECIEGGWCTPKNPPTFPQGGYNTFGVP